MEENTEKKKYLIDEVVGNIKKNLKTRKEGKYNSIPFGIPALDEYVPGIFKKAIYCISASSGIGKL